MKTFLARLILLSVLFACSAEKEKAHVQDDSASKWKDFFRNSKYDFEGLITYLQANYIETEKHAGKLRLVFPNCRVKPKIIPSEICDEHVVDYMVDLGLRDVSVEREFNCEEFNGLNTVYVTLEQKQESFGVKYIYTYCSADHYFENSM